MIRNLAGAFALFVLLGSAQAEAAGFLSAYDDLPLAPGLTEAADGGLSFDSPAGRIVEAFASGRVSPAEITAFYAAALPQLGWTRINASTYRRETEQLKLDVQAQPGGASVHFTIAPE